MVVLPLAARWRRLDNGSRMRRESHVRFWERLGAQLPGSTHLARESLPGTHK
jgi:hypothetical protein